MDTETFSRLWGILWGLIAIYVGYQGFFYTQKFLDGAYAWREKWDKRTGTKFFTAGYPNTNSAFQYWFSKIIGGFFLVMGMVVLITTLYGQYQIVKAKALVTQYEHTFPVLVADNVRSFVDKDWCKYLNYDNRKVYFVDQPNSACSASFGQGEEHSQADLAEFQKLEKLFDNKVSEMGILRNANGEVTSASFTPNNCFWCDTSYYYSASGIPSSTDLGSGFNLGEQINQHWYKVIEDWP